MIRSQGCSSLVHLAQLDSHRLLTRRKGVMLILRLHFNMITMRWLARRDKRFALDFQASLDVALLAGIFLNGSNESVSLMSSSS